MFPLPLPENSCRLCCRCRCPFCHRFRQRYPAPFQNGQAPHLGPERERDGIRTPQRGRESAKCLMRQLLGRVLSHYLTSDNGILSLLRRCNLTLRGAKQIHALLIISGAIADPYAAGQIVAFLSISDRGDLVHANLIFRSLPRPSIFLWNTMIRAHLEKENPAAALDLYAQMLDSGNVPNNYTFSFVLRACLHLSSLSDGRKVHAQISKLGWENYDFVQNELIHMYATCGFVDSARRVFDLSPHRDVISWTAMVHGYVISARISEARELFDEMPERNAVSWSAMITGYVQAELFRDALDLFRQMQRSGTRPNHAGIVGALTACAFLGALQQGRWIHAYIDRNGMKLDRILGTALVDMYAKCGCISTARKLFSEMPERDVFAYTAMISGFSNHGHSEKAIELFRKMEDDGVKPNEITFICVLTSCSRIGMVAEGKKIFKSMSRVYGIEPGVQHYGCMVDLLGRAGLLAEAVAAVKVMPMEPDAYVLGALLNASRVHGNTELARETVESLEILGLDHGGVYVSLSNLYASSKRWHRVAELRKEMESRGARKVPGCSMIEVDGVACEFVAGDGARLLNKDIISMLKMLDSQLRISGLNHEDNI